MKERRGLPEESGSYAYGYDPLGRLASVSRDGEILRSYGYDAFGNRTRKREGTEETGYAYNALNQLVRTVDKGLETTYRYDKRGNLTELYQDGRLTSQYHFGTLNRLEKAADHETGQAAHYRYNGLLHRTGRTEGTLEGQAQQPASQGQFEIHPTREIEDVLDLTRQYHNLLERREGDKSVRYTWDDQVIGATGTEGSHYYLQDELGSPLRLLDQAGAGMETYGYDEFGNGLYQTEGMQPFTYTGYQRDRIAGTYYAQAREYAPTAGRFISRDTISGFMPYAQTLNSYSYCWNDPMNLLDLDGYWPQFVQNIGNGIKNAANAVVNGAKNAVSSVTGWYDDLPDWGKNLIKIGIGVAAIGAGAAVTVATGGAAGPAVVAGLKTAAVVGGVSAGVSATVAGVGSVRSGDDFINGAKKVVNSAVDGFSNGFMTGGIVTGGAMVLRPVLTKASGLKIFKTPKPQYGRITAGYGADSGGFTIIGLANKLGQNRFRIDFDLKHFFHWHYGLTNKARRVHRTGIVEVIIGLFTGLFSSDTEEGGGLCD